MRLLREKQSFLCFSPLTPHLHLREEKDQTFELLEVPLSCSANLAHGRKKIHKLKSDHFKTSAEKSKKKKGGCVALATL